MAGIKRKVGQLSLQTSSKDGRLDTGGSAQRWLGIGGWDRYSALMCVRCHKTQTLDVAYISRL